MTHREMEMWSQRGMQAFQEGSQEQIVDLCVRKLDAGRGHKMVDAKTAKRLPGIRQDGKSETMVQAKWFHPSTGWTWYATEFDPVTGHAFGLVEGMVTELGYFNVYELGLMYAGNPFPLLIERDRYFKPVELSVLQDRYGDSGRRED